MLEHHCCVVIQWLAFRVKRCVSEKRLVKSDSLKYAAGSYIMLMSDANDFFKHEARTIIYRKCLIGPHVALFCYSKWEIWLPHSTLSYWNRTQHKSCKAFWAKSSGNISMSHISHLRYTFNLLFVLVILLLKLVLLTKSNHHTKPWWDDVPKHHINAH